MPQHTGARTVPSHHQFDWLLIILAMIAGMVGGCGAASYQVLTGRELTAYLMTAYATLGAVLGAFSFLILLFITDVQSVQTVLLFAGLLGAGSTMSVAIIRTGIRALLKYKGIEVDIQIRRSDDKQK